MTTQLPLPLRLSDSAAFENFYPGHNAEARMALEACARGSDTRSVYLWSAEGGGKTHLLQAACRRAAETGRATAYLPLGELVALGPAVLEGLEALALVAVDDLQCIAGRVEWEAALFHLYNRIRAGAATLLVAADRAPKALALALPDLESRLGWDLVYRLHPLDDAEKTGALQLRAQLRGLELPAAVADYLLKRAPRDLPSLFALIDRLDLASLAAQRRLTIPFVRELLES